MTKPSVRRALTASAMTGLCLAAPAVPQAAAAQPRAEQPYVTKPCPGDQQYYPDTDPGRFWECSNGIAYRFDCPAGLHWDTELLTCNYPEAAGAVPSPSETRGARRSEAVGRPRIETKYIAGQVITHTIVKPLKY